MRYRDNREQSAELLRMVLPLMSRHVAGFHPLSYAVWYEYAAGLNQPLRAAIDARTAKGEQLGDLEIQQLFDAHVAMRDIESTMKLRARIQEVVEEMGEATSLASEEMGRYSAGLDEAHRKLHREAEVDKVAAVVRTLKDDTSRALDRTSMLHESLKVTSQEARRIGVELEAANGQAQVDPLTGLLNERGLSRHVAEAYPRGLPAGALLRITVDHLRALVSQHGHLLGDRAVSAVAQVLVSTVGSKPVVARTGNGEFTVLMAGADPSTAAEMAERVRGNSEKCRIRRSEGERLVDALTVSTGIAPVSEGETLATCLKRSDVALARAQGEGGNRVAVSTVAQG
jgi:diguanylate cyclase